MILPQHKLEQVDYYCLIEDDYKWVVKDEWDSTSFYEIPINIIRIHWKYTPSKTLWSKIKELFGYRGTQYTDFRFKGRVQKRDRSYIAKIPDDYFELKQQLEAHFKDEPKFNPDEIFKARHN